MNTNDKSLDAPASHLSQVTGDQSPTTGSLSQTTSDTALVTSNQLLALQSGTYKRTMPDGTVLWFYDPDAWWNAPTIKTAESLTEALRATDWFKIKRDRLYPWSLPLDIQSLPPSERPGYLSGKVQPRPRYLPGKNNGSLPTCLLCEQSCYPEHGYSGCCNSQLINDEGLVFLSAGFLPRGTRKPRTATHRSGFKHVCYLAANKGWSAKIRCRGFLIYNGTFDMADDAARAADNLLYALWRTGKVGGDIMRRMNFPEVYFGPLTTLQYRAPYGKTTESVERFLNWINQKEKNDYLKAYSGETL